jgi:hypothetical protein
VHVVVQARGLERLGGKHLDSGGYDLLGVVGGSEGLLGVVTEERMTRVPEERRALTPLVEIMIPIGSVARSTPGESLVYALSRVNPIAPVLTVWAQNRLVGVVPTERLRQRLTRP